MVSQSTKTFFFSMASSSASVALCSEAALDALCNEITAFYQRQDQVSPAAALDAIGALSLLRKQSITRSLPRPPLSPFVLLTPFFPLSVWLSTSTHLQATASAAPSPSAPPCAGKGCATPRRSTQSSTPARRYGPWPSASRLTPSGQTTAARSCSGTRRSAGSRASPPTPLSSPRRWRRKGREILLLPGTRPRRRRSPRPSPPRRRCGCTPASSGGPCLPWASRRT